MDKNSFITTRYKGGYIHIDSESISWTVTRECTGFYQSKTARTVTGAKRAVTRLLKQLEVEERAANIKRIKGE